MKKIITLCLFIIALLPACDNDYIPKPRGFFRIDVPKHTYDTFDSTNYPYQFMYPAYAQVETHKSDEPYWIDIKFLPFNAILYISYKNINNNLNVYLDDARAFVNKHIPKADAISENLYLNANASVYGLVYNIEGREAASPLQFYLTDSTQHFIRGALYFNFTPDNDSLAPVIDFIKEDITAFIESFKWNNSPK